MEVKGKTGTELYVMFSSLWAQKFTSAHINNDFIESWCKFWQESLKDIDTKLIDEAVNYCANNLEWPPTLAEFKKLCERSLNIPSPRECLELAVRRDFTQPIVKELFDKVGSWDMKNGKQSDLLKRFEAHHKEYIADSRVKKLENDECNRSKIVHKTTQGSVNDERKYIARNSANGTDMRKAEDYLF